MLISQSFYLLWCSLELLCLWPSSFSKFPYLPVYFLERKTTFCWKIQDCRWLTITTGTLKLLEIHLLLSDVPVDMFEYYVKLFFLSQKDYKLAHMLSKYINLICKAVMWPGMGRSGQIRSHICLGLTGLVGALPRDISSIHPLTGYQ